jgi:hypothetical protein
MAGTLPQVPIPAAITIKSLTPTLVSVAQNMRRISRTLGYHRWSMDMQWVQLERADMAEIYAFMVSQNGQYENFNVIIPGHEAPRGIYDSGQDTPIVDGNGQTGTSINLMGLRASGTNILVKGDYLKFANHGKVYIVTADMSSDSPGDATVEIFPAVQATIVASEAVQVENVDMAVASLDDVAESMVRPPLLYNYKVELIEDPV